MNARRQALPADYFMGIWAVMWVENVYSATLPHLLGPVGTWTDISHTLVCEADTSSIFILSLMAVCCWGHWISPKNNTLDVPLYSLLLCSAGRQIADGLEQRVKGSLLRVRFDVQTTCLSRSGYLVCAVFSPGTRQEVSLNLLQAQGENLKPFLTQLVCTGAENWGW